MNTSKGLGGFFNELRGTLWLFDHPLVVDTGCSMDWTAGATVNALPDTSLETVLNNTMTGGHPPTTMRALLAGLVCGADIFMALDGTRQFVAEPVAQCAGEIESLDVDVIEDLRVSREDPGYRSLPSMATRLPL